MATSATVYFGNRCKAAVGVAGFTPALADLFTVDRGFEANMSWEMAKLFGTDSIFRVDEAKYQFESGAKLRGCKFNPAVSGGSGIFQMMLNTLNGATAGTGAVADTNTVYLMDVYIYSVGSDTPADNKFAVKVANAFMEPFTIPFPENDYIILDLSFSGRTAVLSNSAAPT
jgi:hypothetical protein